ncbi:MAG: T9SS type A sorting domain-containing protein [Flavobacteriaceae bacterium]|nr:T9SS type A sorting domain-containing protein [Flavobacteriaceae bacterium]
MKKITFLFLTFLLSFVSWQTWAQSTIHITTSGGSYATEKWVSITTEANGAGTQVWGQGNGTYGNGAGLINLDISIAPGTYYVNCYDKYADGWDGTLISVTAYASTLTNNGGVSPDGNGDLDASANWGDTQAQELEASLMIVVPNPPTCFPPSALTASGISSSGASLSWTAGGSESVWNVQYGVSGFTLGSGTIVNGVNNPNVISGLSSATNYQYYVQSDCGGSDLSAWTGPFAFTTLCESVGAISENFNSITTPSLPLCWSKITPAAYTYATVTTVTTPVSSAPNAVQLYSSDATAATDNVLLISPVLSNLSAGTHQLRFKARGASTNTSIIVGTMSNNADGATFTPFQTVTGLNTGAYNEYVVNFSSYSGTDTYIAFRHPLTTTYSYVYVDDVVWEPIPSCPSPSSLTTTAITATSANFQWTENGSATTWNVEYKAGADFTPGTGAQDQMATVAVNPYGFAGLTSGTTYYWYVQADCGSGSTSIWSGPFSFTTQFLTSAPYLEAFNTTITPIGYNSGFSIGSVRGVTGNPANNIYKNLWSSVVTSNFTTININNIANGMFFSYDYKLANYSSPYAAPAAGSGSFIVSVSTDFGVTYIPLETVENNGIDGWKTKSYDFSSYAGQTVKLKFVGNWISGDYDLAFDNIKIEIPPTCPAPSTLTNANISTSSSDFDWTENGSATSWNVEIKTATDFTPGTGASDWSQTVSAHPVNFAVFQPNTTYYWYVQADCGSGNTSTWTGPKTFTTLALPPTNDNCLGATSLVVNPDYSCGSVTAGTLAGATASGVDEAACYGTENDDVWFSFVATNTVHRVSLTNVTGTPTDLYHSLWTGDCTALTLVTGSCSDSDTSNPSALTIGQTYYVRVNSYSSASGANTSFNVCIGTPPPPPANDGCSSAINVTTLPYSNTQDAAGATNNAGFILACSTGTYGGMNDGVWYSFTVETAGSFTVALSGVGAWDPQLDVYSGSCGTFSCISNQDVGISGGAETATFAGEAGVTYYVNVGYWSNTTNNSEGPFTVTISGDGTLGTPITNIDGFKLYPNPTNSVLNINALNTIDSVVIYSMLGQKVMSQSTDNNQVQLDLSNLPTGSYIVRVQAGNQVGSYNLIKN